MSNNTLKFGELQRLAKNAGAKSISLGALKPLQDAEREWLAINVEKLQEMAEHAKRVTVTVADAMKVLNDDNEEIMYGTPEKCKLFKAPKKRLKKKRAHGRVATLEFDFYEAQQDCLYIAKQPFVRLIREIGEESSTHINRFAQDAITVIRVSLEIFLKQTIRSALELTLADKRLIVKQWDVERSLGISDDEDEDDE